MMDSKLLINPPKGIFKDVRDSIYIETSYPDYIAPIEIGVGQIKIDAEPVNPDCT